MWNAISADPFQTRRWIIKIFALILVGVMLARYTSSDRRLRVLTSTIILIGVASAFFGIFRQTIQRTDGFLFLSRLRVNSGYAQFINRNQFAFLAEMSLGLALGLLVGRGVKRETRLIYLAVSLPLWVAIAMSASRGSVIAILSEVLFLLVIVGMVQTVEVKAHSTSRLIHLINSRMVRGVILAGLVVSIFVGTVWIAGDRLTSRFEAVEMEMQSTDTLPAGANRLEIWRATLGIIKDHPFLGVGFGGYWVAVPHYHRASGQALPLQAHNDYLELLASGGLVGLAIVAWVFFSVISEARRSWKNSPGWVGAARLGALTGIFGVLVHSLADFGLHNIANASMFAALIVITIRRVNYRT
jgi:O-antigen ligase